MFRNNSGASSTNLKSHDLGPDERSMPYTTFPQSRCNVVEATKAGIDWVFVPLADERWAETRPEKPTSFPKRF